MTLLKIKENITSKYRLILVKQLIDDIKMLETLLVNFRPITVVIIWNNDPAQDPPSRLSQSALQSADEKFFFNCDKLVSSVLSTPHSHHLNEW